jgi:hypothetical protein
MEGLNLTGVNNAIQAQLSESQRRQAAIDALPENYAGIPLIKPGEKKKDFQSRVQGWRGNEILAGRTSGGILSGTPKEKQGQIAGLNLGLLSYGQGLKETGQDVQSLKKRLEARSQQSAANPETAGIRSQAGEAAAAAQRNLLASNVKGGAALGAMDAIKRKNSAAVAQSLYGQVQRNDQDYRSLLGNIISSTTALMQGEKAANVDMPSYKEPQGFISKIFG